MDKHEYNQMLTFLSGLLTVQQVANQKQIWPEQLKRYFAQGRGPNSYVIAGQRFCHKDDVAKWNKPPDGRIKHHVAP